MSEEDMGIFRTFSNTSSVTDSVFTLATLQKMKDMMAEAEEHRQKGINGKVVIATQESVIKLINVGFLEWNEVGAIPYSLRIMDCVPENELLVIDPHQFLSWNNYQYPKESRFALKLATALECYRTKQPGIFKEASDA